jgi:hypothetical protein
VSSARARDEEAEVEEAEERTKQSGFWYLNAEYDDEGFFLMFCFTIGILLTLRRRLSNMRMLHIVISTACSQKVRMTGIVNLHWWECSSIPKWNEQLPPNH